MGLDLRIYPLYTHYTHLKESLLLPNKEKQAIPMSPYMLSYFSRVRLFVTLWTVAYQAPLSMEFSRQEHWSGQPFPSPGDLPNPGIKPGFSALQADSLTSEPPRKPLNSLAMTLQDVH